MKTKVNVPRSGIVLSVFLQGLVFAAGAHAAQAAPPVEAGLLQLPNVKIQVATPKQIEAAALQRKNSATTSGVRAYKDKDTGHFRQQTPEEMIEESAASTPMSSEPVAIIAPLKGGVAALLDESFMSNAVVHKDASGKLQMECVTGKDAVAKSLIGGKTIKGHGHDH